MTRRKLIILTTLFLTGTVFLVTEVGLRIYQQIANGIPFTSFLPGYKETRFPLSPFLVFGPRVNWQIPHKKFPQHAYFNSQAFRTPDPVGKKTKDEYRIITLGGSTTEDLWNDEGIHWPLVLEQELHRRGYKSVRVLNTGMSAYTTAHSLIRYEFDVVEHEPDMIIVMHNINDLLVNYFAARDQQEVDPHYKVLYGNKSYTGEIGNEDIVFSRVVHSVASRLKRWQNTSAKLTIPDSDISRGRIFFKRNLTNLVRLTRANGTVPVLLTMPIAKSQRIFDGTVKDNRPYPRYERFLQDFSSYNQAVREVGKELGATVIDMNTLFADNDDYFADFVHYSTKGSRAFGAVLSAHIVNQIRKKNGRIAGSGV